jgi:transposase-like protein
MTRKYDASQGAIRYSEAFKAEVVRELEREGLPFDHVRRKYGIGGSWTVQRWVHTYGNGSRGKVIRVERPEEINEKEQLKRRVRALEGALADANIDLALERQYTRLACERAGIRDVAEFKKKASGPRPTEP